MANQNSLTTSIKNHNDPLRSYRFLVEVDGTTVGAFTQFSGIKMEVRCIKARSGNDNRGVLTSVPVMTGFEPVTLTKGVIGDNEFMNWVFAAAASMNSGPTGSNLKRDMDVVALDDDGNRGVIWTLKGAMPIRYEVSPMDSSRSEVLSESVTFAIGGVKRTVGSLGKT